MSDDLIFTKDDEGQLRPIEYGSSNRERPRARRHKTYEQDHWETAHIDRVDNIGAYESAPFGDGPIRSRGDSNRPRWLRARWGVHAQRRREPTVLVLADS